ncbi:MULTISPECIES: YqaA family protein [unclassified Beijerinckia]|uniref:YqaA family protein n=1 Tax=unclassified Beijerinckia TaxID=2638183 RepID=UPI00089B2EBF|nr:MULTISPECIES: YqaA family protein [unclassified Beijerinckia]MDH7797923.1 membrane protein YqaA with SNARE-associated domain [Beijerinckia sp. GAS462]SED02982.1 membrane protein YqaA, SNARE-associated domain [Beijerinckia sp. 28-YEA-48]
MIAGVYATLFATAFLAATILPFSSELVLVGYLATSDRPWAMLIAVASLGNVLGSITNWALGRGLNLFRERRWFPVDARALARAERWYHRYGRWSLLLSWVPIIGDPLTVIAGFLREPLWIFILIVGVVKVARYLVVAAAVAGFV